MKSAMANARCVWRIDATSGAREAKMWRLVLALALVSCSTPSARADEWIDNPEAIATCIASANGDRTALESCRGAIARPCFEQHGPGTMSDVLCWSAEGDAWDREIAAAIERLNQRTEGRDPARLAAAQTAWEAWRESECEYWAWEEGGGSGEQVVRVECAVDASTDRAINLLARPN
jgi:uncharacterized protein YecT (DUF1311 family)